MVSKIVSGGQTGVDRAALDFAITRGMLTAVFAPKGDDQRAEGFLMHTSLLTQINLLSRYSPYWILPIA